MSFFALEPEYCNGGTDPVVRSVSVFLNDDGKTVASCAEDSPAALNEFIDLIERVRSDLSWEPYDASCRLEAVEELKRFYKRNPD